MRRAIVLALLLGGLCFWPTHASQQMLAGVGGAVNAETWSTGLVACWSLDEASGTRTDSVGGNNLTDNNTVTQAVGKVSNAAQFTAANSEYLSIADNASTSTGDIDFSWAAWVYLDTKTDNLAVINKSPGVASDNQYEYSMIYLSGIDRFRWQVGSGSANATIAADALGSPSTATWYFIVGWHDAAGDTVNIHVNNGTVSSAAYSGGGYDSAGGLKVGINADGASFPHDGRIDAVMFWKRVLTAAERTSLWNGGAGRACP